MTYVSQQALFKIIVLKSFLGLNYSFITSNFIKIAKALKCFGYFSVRPANYFLFAGSLKSCVIYTSSDMSNPMSLLNHCRPHPPPLSRIRLN